MDYLLSIADQIWTWITTNPGPASAVAAFVAIAITVIEKLTGALSSLFTMKQSPDQEPLHVKVEAAAPLAPDSDGTVTFTIEAYERRQQELKDQLTAEIEEAEGEKRELLLREKAVVEGKLANLETSFAEAEQTIQGLKEEIQRLGNELDPELRERAERVLGSGDFDEAEKLFFRITDHGDLEVEKTASAYFQRGKIAEEQIRWLDAADHYKRAADLAPNPDRLDKAGEFLWRAGRSGEAVRYQEDLLAIRKREAGETAPETATALNHLAIIYRYLGRYEEAEPLFRQSLEIDKATIGEGHPEYANDLNNLASLLQDMGRFEEAEPLIRQALKIDKTTIGEGHPNYAARLGNLANLLRAMGRYAEAEPLCAQALEIDKATVGEWHPDYATRLKTLALLLQAMGRYEEAELLYREALEIDRATIGEWHPEYAIDLNYLALLLQDMGRFEEAEPLFDQAIAIWQAKLGPDHPNTKTGIRNREIFRAEWAAAQGE